MVCIQFLIISFISMLVATKGKITIPKEKTTIFFCGLYNGLMTIFYPYSADPERTQPIMQAILAGLKIMPSVCGTKLILKKHNEYNLRYIIPSVLCLTVSVVLTVIPLKSHFNKSTAFWIFIFLLGMLCAALYSIYQEKYIMDTNDNSNKNKLVLIFWSRLLQTFMIASCYWVEYLMGYEDDPAQAFRDSAKRFATNYHDALLLEAGIIAYLLMYIVATYLNAISTNYNMIANAGVQPVVILFFTIFNNLNTGIQYPWYISVLCAIFGLTSIMLWMKGEAKVTIDINKPLNHYVPLNDDSV